MVVLLLIISTALAAPAAMAADSASPLAVVTAHLADGSTSQQSITFGDLKQNAGCPADDDGPLIEYDRDGTRYTVGIPGEGSATTGSWDLATLLRCLATPVSWQAVNRVIVDGASGAELGASSMLSKEDIDPAGPDFSQSQRPAISALGSALEYDRPWRGGSDPDFADQIVQNGPIGLDVYEGNALGVSISLSSTTVALGTPTALSAAVSGAVGSVSYHWTFPNSGVADSSAENPTVTFSAAGTYSVDVVANDAHGGGGGAQATITVTGPAPAPTPTTSTTSDPSGGTSTSPAAPTRGPRRGRPGHPGTVTSSRTTPGSTTAPTRTSPTRTEPGDTSTSPSPPNHRPPPRIVPTPTTTSPAPPVTSTSTTTTTTAAPPTTTTSETTPSPHRHARLARHAGGVGGPLVDGRLVGAISAVPAASSPLARDATAPAAGSVAARRSSVTSPWPSIAGGLVALALVGLGAAREQLPGWLRRALRLRG